MVQLSQEGLAVDAVNHAGFLNGLAAGRGAAQAVHTDSEEQGSSVGCDIQNITDDGGLFNLNRQNYDLLLQLLPYYNLPFAKKQGGKCKNLPTKWAKRSRFVDKAKGQKYNKENHLQEML